MLCQCLYLCSLQNFDESDFEEDDLTELLMSLFLFRNKRHRYNISIVNQDNRAFNN